MRVLQLGSRCCSTHRKVASFSTTAIKCRSKHTTFASLPPSGHRKRQKVVHSCKATADSDTEVQAEGSTGSSDPSKNESKKSKQKVDKEMAKFATKAATTFAPRASGASKNPAFKGSLLYTIFEVQAWLFLAVGGLLSFNVIFPSEEPNIARLLGMWSIWMFTIPALRARDCSAAEKEALNYLFLLVPILNVSLPFLWKSFPFIYSADVVALAALYAWKVGLPFGDQETS